MKTSRRSWLFLCSGLMLGLLLPIPAFAQRPDSNRSSRAQAIEEAGNVEKKSEQGDSKTETPIPEESRDERRARLRLNAIQGMGSPTNLLTIPRVFRELQLSERQIKNVQEHQKMMLVRLQLMYRGVRDLPRSEQARKMRELQPEADRFKSQGQVKLLEFLTEEQRDRLWGMSLQVRGPIALLDPEVAALLELTEEQIEQIMEIAEEMDADLTRLAARFSVPDPSGNSPLPNRNGSRGALAIRAEAEQKMLEVLTPSQRRKYQELQGDKFDFRETELPAPADPSPATEPAPSPVKRD
jgi:hypothetical protein